MDELLTGEAAVPERESSLEAPANEELTPKSKKRTKKPATKQPTGKMIYLNGRALEIIE